MSAVETLKALVIWPFAQAWGFLTNFWSWLTDKLHLKDVLLPSIYDSLVWIRNQVPLALGMGKPGEMLEASFVLAVATFATGIITGGLAWFFIGIWVVTAFLGLLRFVPAVEKRWPVGGG